MAQRPSHGCGTAKTAFEELLAEVFALDEQHAASDSSRRVARRLQPLISFVERYAVAVDVAVQGCPSPAILVWGALRGLLIIAGSLSRYFDRLLAALENLGMTVSVYSRYEVVIRDGQAFRTALGVVYSDIIGFLERARKVLKRSGLSTFVRGIWHDFENEFNATLNTLSQHTEALREEATLAYRVQLHGSVITQSDMLVSLLDSRTRANLQTERSELLEWLVPVDTHQDFLRESRKRLNSGGAWFMTSQQFQSWVNRSTRLLWAFGTPGSGKTVLSTNVIDRMQSQIGQNEQLAFFYFDRSDEAKRSSLAMMSSILSQILAQCDSIPPAISAAVENSKRLGRSKITLADSPCKLIKAATLNRQCTYLVVDGVDETDDPSHVLEDLLDLQQSTNNFSVLVFTRDVPCIRSKLSNCRSIQLNITNTQADIDSYILEAIKCFQLSNIEPELETMIIDRLRSGANGMFLWVQLMVLNLKSATMPSEVSRILQSLPQGLDAAYEQSLRILATETVSRQELARKVICWTCFSSRPLTWPELQCALSIDPEILAPNVTRRPFLSVVLELCSAFIVHDPGSDIIRPLHASICEYLTNKTAAETADSPIRKFFPDESVSHQRIGLECLAYLSLVCDVDQTEDELRSWPLAKYASSSWLEHILCSTYETKVDQKMVEFLSSPCRRRWIVHFLLSQREIFPLQRLFRNRERLLQWSCLHYNEGTIIYFDWTTDIAKILIDLDFIRTRMLPITLSAEAALDINSAGTSYFERMMIVRDLARQFTQTGRLSSAIGIFERALIARQSVYCSMVLETLWLLNTLGILYDQEQLLQKAAQTQEEALRIQANAFGLEHSETVWTKNELGRIYRHQGRLDVAEQLHLDALRILRTTQSKPDQDPEVAWTLSTLARVYRKQRRYDEAISMSMQALTVRKKLLGGSHPHCLWLVCDIAQCYFEDGHLAEAADHHRQALEGRKVVLGIDHPDTLWTMNNLGVVLAALGQDKWLEALEVQRQAYNGRKRVLGVEDPHTQWTEKVLHSLELEERSSVPNG